MKQDVSLTDMEHNMDRDILRRAVILLIVILILCAAASFKYLPSAFAGVLLAIACAFVTLTAIQISRGKEDHGH